MNVTNGEVYTFKLNSGEELVARVEASYGDELHISEPVSIAPSQQGLGLIPSFFTAEPKAEVRLNKNSVALYAPVKQKYIQALTGIVMPDKKIIMG